MSDKLTIYENTGNTLWDININLLQAMHNIEEAEANGLEPDENTLTVYNDAIKALALKVDNCVKFNDFLESQSDRIRSEKERLSKKIAIIERMQERFKDYMIEIAKQQGGSLKGELYSAKVSSRQSVNILDEEVIPIEYKHSEVVTKVNKKLIAAALKGLVDVPGAELESNEFITFR